MNYGINVKRNLTFENFMANHFIVVNERKMNSVGKRYTAYAACSPAIFPNTAPRITDVAPVYTW
jgi:hypothetical protein